MAQRHDTIRDLQASQSVKCTEMWRQSHSCNHSTSREVDKARSEVAYEGRRFLDTGSNGVL